MRCLLTTLLLVSMSAYTFDNDDHGLDCSQDWPSMLDSLDYINLEALGASEYCLGVAYVKVLDEYYLWVSDAASQAGNSNVFHIISLDGTLIGTFEQNETSGSGLNDLCWDGQYMYGSDGVVIDYYDCLYNKQGSFFCYAADPNRAMACDWTYFYTGNLTNEVFRVVWNGVSGSTANYTVWSTAVANGAVVGAAYDDYNDCIWISTAASDYHIYQINMDGSLRCDYTYGILSARGCTVGSIEGAPPTQSVALWVIDPGPPCALRALLLVVTPLMRETWGAIKALF